MTKAATILAAALLAAPAVLGAAIPNPQEAPAPPTDDIVGGKPATKGAYPWIGFSAYNGGQFCGGTMIASNIYLTAAHCDPRKIGYPLSGVTVSANRYNKDSTSATEKGVDFTVSKIINHPNYNANTNLNDLSVWVLKVKKNYGGPVSYIPYGSVPAVGASVNIAGWGLTNPNDSSSDATILQEAKVPIVSKATCQAAYSASQITDTVLCASFHGTGGVDTCQGDSGGPLWTQTASGPKLQGITSWGIGCARADKPGVYTKVDSYVSWITTQVQANAQ